MEMLIAT